MTKVPVTQISVSFDTHSPSNTVLLPQGTYALLSNNRLVEGDVSFTFIHNDEGEPASLVTVPHEIMHTVVGIQALHRIEFVIDDDLESQRLTWFEGEIIDVQLTEGLVTFPIETQ